MKKPFLRTSAWPLALCLVLLFTFTSCEKEEAQPTPVITCLPSKTYNEADPTEYTTYQYDAQRRVTQITDFRKGEESRTLLYEYNTLGQVEKITIKDQDLNVPQASPDKIFVIYTFEYNSLGQVIKYLANKPWREDLSARRVSTCEYDAEGNRTKIRTTNEDGSAAFTTVYTYKDGNCIQGSTEPNTGSANPTQYQYDLTKENKLRNFHRTFDVIYLIEATPSKNVSAGNSRTYLNAEYNSSVKRTYKYNADGLPAKVNETWVSSYNTILIDNIMEYVCQ